MYFSSKNSIKFLLLVLEICIIHKLKSTTGICTWFVIGTADNQQIGWQIICLSAKKSCKFLLFDIYRCFAATTGIPPEEPNEQTSMCSMCVMEPLRQKFWLSHQRCHVWDQITGSTWLICTSFIWSTALLCFSGSSEQRGNSVTSLCGINKRPNALWHKIYTSICTFNDFPLNEPKCTSLHMVL